MPWVIADNRDLWIGLDIEARRGVAKMPFVILDAYFKGADWWHRVTSVADPRSSQGLAENP